MLIIKDKDLNEIGILDNAYNKKVKRRVNELWIGSFSMPIDDPKTTYAVTLTTSTYTGQVADITGYTVSCRLKRKRVRIKSRISVNTFLQRS